MSNRREPYFEIILNGRSFDYNMIKYVVEVQVEEAGKKASLARITVADWDGVWLNDKGIAKGSTIAIRMGYVNNHRRVFHGQIMNIEADYPEDGTPLFVITCLDDGVTRLSAKKHTRTFRKEKESAVITRLIREAGMNPEVEDSKVVVDTIYQNNLTNAEFIDRFCKKKGWYRYKTPHQTYYVGSKPEPKTQVEHLGYKTGGNEIKSFKPTITEIEKEG